MSYIKMPDITSMKIFVENDKEMPALYKWFLNDTNKHRKMEPSPTTLHKPKNL
jgi:hypothetical protein